MVDFYIKICIDGINSVFKYTYCSGKSSSSDIVCVDELAADSVEDMRAPAGIHQNQSDSHRRP